MHTDTIEVGRGATEGGKTRMKFTRTFSSYIVRGWSHTKDDDNNIYSAVLALCDWTLLLLRSQQRHTHTLTYGHNRELLHAQHVRMFRKVSRAVFVCTCVWITLGWDCSWRLYIWLWIKRKGCWRDAKNVRKANMREVGSWANFTQRKQSSYSITSQSILVGSGSLICKYYMELVWLYGGNSKYAYGLAINIRVIYKIIFPE